DVPAIPLTPSPPWGERVGVTGNPASSHLRHLGTPSNLGRNPHPRPLPGRERGSEGRINLAECGEWPRRRGRTPSRPPPPSRGRVGVGGTGFEAHPEALRQAQGERTPSDPSPACPELAEGWG